MVTEEFLEQLQWELVNNEFVLSCDILYHEDTERSINEGEVYIQIIGYRRMWDCIGIPMDFETITEDEYVCDYDENGLPIYEFQCVTKLK